MATYYKYAERDVNSQIDWSSVGKQISTMLYQQAKLREDKRDAFDKQSADDAKVYENIPTGDMLSLNEKYQNFSDDAQKYRLQQERMLRGGLLDPRDYKRSRQRFLDDTTRFFDLGKEAQTAYSDIMKRMQEGTSSFLEEDVALSVEGLGNLQNLSPMINPATGAVNVARMVAGPDGVQVIDKDHIMDVNEMGQYINFRYDKFDKDAFVQNKVKGLGGFITSKAVNAAKGGDLNQILKVSDPKLRDDFNTYLNASVNELTANPYAAASILGDYMSDKVKITRSREEAEGNDNLVYVGIDENGGVKVELSEGQKNKVKKYLSDQIKASLSESLEIKGTSKPFDPTRSLWINRTFDKEDKAQQFALIRSAIDGDKTAMQTLMTGYNGTDLAFDPDQKFMDITVRGVVKPVSLTGDSVTAGSNLAAALGLSPEEYNTWAKENNVLDSVVDFDTITTNFEGVRGVEQVGQIVSSENIRALNKSLTMTIDDFEIEKGNVSDQAKSFARVLQSIAAPLNIDTSVDELGNVTVGGVVIENGINKADTVLDFVDRAYRSRPKQAPVEQEEEDEAEGDDDTVNMG